jgi:sulfhydrogenase subunit beta (sulfur reductase)
MAQFIPRASLQTLIDVLAARGYRVVGPQVSDGAIVYADLQRVEQLPKGIHSRQRPGSYRLQSANEDLLFAWANGPQALKPFLFAPQEPMWRAEKSDQGFKVQTLSPESTPLAVIGARACDLAALALQDKVFLEGSYIDPYYLARREGMFLVAVNCTHAADTCFCAATHSGPRAESGFDLALTELVEGFVIELGSQMGDVVLSALQAAPASQMQTQTASSAVKQAAASQTRGLPPEVKDRLAANLHHPRWNEVAKRCLSCGNCTQVCPSCFCHAEYEAPALDGASSNHERRWDSCFSQGHAYIHGMQIRPEIRHRYRQWLTHKLSIWHAQFGSSGCVGCGRCIAWCPAGIDLTEEAGVICGGDDASLS